MIAFLGAVESMDVCGKLGYKFRGKFPPFLTLLGYFARQSTVTFVPVRSDVEILIVYSTVRQSTICGFYLLVLLVLLRLVY